LKNEDTLAGQITAGDYRAADGRQVVAYNLGYPIMSLAKDLLLLDTAMAVEPDLIIWPVTLHSFLRDKQLDPPIVHENPERMRHLINEYSLGLNPEASSFIEPDFLGRTIVGQRRALADLLRLQLYGFSWAATSIDQVYPEEIDLRTSDFEDDESWLSFEESVLLSDEDLVFDILAAGVVRAGEVPLLIVNEPIFVSSGQNSHIRYNAWYPRWAYDRYREMLDNLTKANNWDYLDLWDLVSPEQFTDSPVHLTPDGVAILSKTIIDFRFSLTKRLRSNTAD
jgi:hypothetical protein